MLEFKSIEPKENERNKIILEYNCKHFESQDYDKLNRLIYLLNEKKSSQDILKNLPYYNSPAEFIEFYYKCSSEEKVKIRDFAKEKSSKLNKYSPLTLPDEEMFLEIEKNGQLEECLKRQSYDYFIDDPGSPSPDNLNWTRVVLR